MEAPRLLGISFTIIIGISFIINGILHAEDSGNLLQNPSFEEGLSEWSTYGGIFSLVESPVQSGAFAAALTTDTPNTIWIYQTISIREGENYTFCGYALKNDPNIEIVFLRISWYDSEDGFGAELSHNDSLTTLTDNQPLYRLLTTDEITAPLNAHSARIKAVLDTFSQTPVTVYLDDFAFVGPTPTPPPTSTPAQIAVATPTPTTTTQTQTTFMPTPTLKPTLNQTPLPSASQTNSWSQIKIPAIFFFTGLTILATVFLLRK